MYDGYAALSPRRSAEAEPVVSADGLVSLIVRIDEAINAETASIRSEPRFDVAASNRSKSRHLFDLSRALRGQTPQTLGAPVASALSRLRETLDENSQVIAAHLAAVSEIASLMKGAIQSAETDGTYSESQFGRSI